MNNILFKGKNKKQNEWVEGFYYQLPITNTDNQPETIHYIISFVKKNGHVKRYMREVIPKSVGLFIGATEDFSNTDEYEPRKIFTGDILQVDYNGDKINCEVAFSDAGFVLISDSFYDGYIYASDLVCSIDDDTWLNGAKFFGNTTETPFY